MNSKIYENFLEANEIARKIYYLKFKKYIGIIYLIVGAYVPITLAVSVILRINTNPSLSYLSTGMFILDLIPVIFLNTKLLELYKIINKLNKIIYKRRDIYSIIYDIIMKILIGLVIVCGFLYNIGIGGDLIVFWIIELWLFYTFFRLKFKISLEDWLAILSPVGLILQIIYPYSVLIFASIWIFSGVVSMVRAYGKP